MKRAAFILISCGALFFATLAAVKADTQAGATTAPTFTKDIAPILYKNCVSCHRAGEIGPMPLITYQDVRPWAKAIKTQVSARVMPPWGADPQHGRFRNDRSLSDTEIAMIASWVDGGAPKGNDADLPAVPTLASGWTRGQPDVVVEMPVDFDIPAEGQVDVTDFYVKAPFTTDAFVKALDVRPGVPEAVHHAGVYVIDKLPPGATLVNGRILSAAGKPMSRRDIARANGQTGREENNKLLSFVPGRGYEHYQLGAGQRIRSTRSTSDACCPPVARCFG